MGMRLDIDAHGEGIPVVYRSSRIEFFNPDVCRSCYQPVDLCKCAWLRPRSVKSCNHKPTKTREWCVGVTVKSCLCGKTIQP